MKLDALGRIFCVAFCLVCVSLKSNAAEINVPGDYITIQSAISAASPGDSIVVDSGTYVENLNFGGKILYVRSINGPESTILAPAGGTGVKMGPGGEFSGFTVTGASAYFGAGMAVSGTGSVIRGNIFSANQQLSGGYGAAIGGNVASPIIEQNVFKYNTCDGQYLSGVVSFINGSSPVIQNNIFVDNPCRAINFVLPSSAAPLVINNTVARNLVGFRVSRSISAVQQIFRNNILYGNNTGMEAVYGTDAENPTFENNLVFGNGVDYQLMSNQTGINGNLSSDPMFQDDINDNFMLTSGSPAIDAGSSVRAPDNDFDNNVRPQDGDGDGVAAVDIGAYEFPQPVIDIKIAGGSRNVECLSPNGTQTTMQTSAPNNDESYWYVNGGYMASGDVVDLLLQKGSNTVELQNGNQIVLDAVAINVVDTVSPTINAQFVDPDTGQIVTSLNSSQKEKVKISIDVTDQCDPNPTHNAVVGLPTDNNESIIVNVRRDNIGPLSNSVELSVNASDADGNLATDGATLIINN